MSVLCFAARSATNAIRNRWILRSGSIGAAVFAAITQIGVSAASSAATISEDDAIHTSPLYPGVTCRRIEEPMRDGIRLNGYLYLPAKGARHPVILQRNPYGYALGDGCFSKTAILLANLPIFAQHGYAAMSQDVRGTNLSEGVFHPMIQEAGDGYEAIEWIARQPWSTGKVGTTSGSYLGLTQWQPAIHTPPHLAAIAPQITASDYHDNWTYVNGVFDLWFGQSWLSSSFVPDQINRAGKAVGLKPAQIKKQEAAWAAAYSANLATKWVSQLPLTGFPEFTVYAPYYYEWLHHPYYDTFWSNMDVEPHYANVRVPALINTASYDIFSVGSIRNFNGMRTEAGTTEARVGTKLIMGAYGHAGDSGHPTFGDDSGLGTLLDADTLLVFFDRYLKGIHNGWESSPVARIYVLLPPNSGETGTGFWISGGGFPLPGSRLERYYLASDGSANTRSGDGKLVSEVDASWAGRNGTSFSQSPADHFLYDPSKPVPTVGGNTCCIANLIPIGAQDQTPVETRSDVLVYTSKNLSSDKAVIGSVRASLWATSSATDTDFTVKLVDVHPDGVTHNVLNRIVRARLRAGSKQPPSLIDPGRAYQYDLELGNTATMFRKGHRIRVDISSSDFPHFERNLNTGRSNEDSSATIVAHQTILHDTKHRSFVELPVAPNVKIPTSALESSDGSAAALFELS